ncbi:hypothetical protein [Blastomonas fulva]|uniref:hypothetical protein n=1 Tax=Blastomonas fulva TaxID=1550728 RepID=UPI003F730835
MSLVRPRLTEHHQLALNQASVSFAIPFLDEDLPLYVDPFLLWKSPSQQDHSLHVGLMAAFNHLGHIARKGKGDQARDILIQLSECDEVGLGNSATRSGKRIGTATADTILSLFHQIPKYVQDGMEHLEEVQLLVDGISKDRISDFTCNLIKSFLIDYTIEESERVGIPLSDVVVPAVYNPRTRILQNEAVKLPVHPISGKPLLLVPKRWLRHAPWISYDDYFKAYVPKDDRLNEVTWERVQLLAYNRQNYGAIEGYVKLKERAAADCHNDPLFKQIPVVSARRKLAEIAKLPSGKEGNADRKYEDAVTALLASMFYPHLDFADTQARTDSGAQIRDLIFYNNRDEEFLKDIERQFGSRQLVMELKNVKAVEREHVNQLHRYLGNEFGQFGVLVTRNRLPRAIRQNTIDLWSSKRTAIIPLIDEDLNLMVDLFEQKQRAPLDVLKRSYLTFTKECPV